MLRTIGRRLLLLIPTLFGLSVLLFAWVRALPGGPAVALLGERATPEAVARINELYGFNEPIISQYFSYVKALASGDFGRSIKDGQPVWGSFVEKFPATLELGLTALMLAVVVGIPLGYFAARNQGRFLDTFVVSGSLLGVVTPVFFLAILLKLVFAEWLGWLPTLDVEGAELEKAAHGGSAEQELVPAGR